jgi:hypothetical protein
LTPPNLASGTSSADLEWPGIDISGDPAAAIHNIFIKLRTQNIFV